MNQSFLLDGKIEFERVEEEIIRKRLKLRNGGDHCLPAGLIDVPGVYAAGINFGDGPGQSVLADALGENEASLVFNFLGIIEALTMRRVGLRITAAATTGPNNSDPRPASSSPAIRSQPRCRASRS